MCQFKKIHRLERTQETLLYRSKTVVFRDVTKIEILQVTVLRMLPVRILHTCSAFSDQFKFIYLYLLPFSPNK